MKIDLKCFSALSNPETCNYEGSKAYDLDDGQTVSHLVRRAGIAGEAVKVVFVNSRIMDLNTVLSDGDHVALVPATGGM